MKRWLFVLALCSVVAVKVIGQGTLAPNARFTAWDNNGLIVAGAKLCTYSAGTTTPLATYSDADLAVGHQNTNPVVTDSAGRAIVYLSQTSYKFTLYSGGTAATCDGTQIWSQDNVTSVPTTSGNVDVTGTAGQTITAGQAVYLSDGSGGKIAGQWYLADAGNTYSSTTAEVGIAPAAIAAGASGTIRLIGRSTGLSGLIIGTEYFVGSTGALTATLPKLTRHVGHADTSTSLVQSSDPPAFVVNQNGLPTLQATDGQILIGRTSDHAMVLAQLTAGNGMAIVNTSGGITLTTGTFGHSATTSANPSGTASGTGVMMGLAGSIKPMSTGTVLFCMGGSGATDTSPDGWNVQLRFGTGAAPANGAALTGTAIGASQVNTIIATNNQKNGFGGCAKATTNLAVNTTFWYDVAVTATTGGTATVTGVVLSADELP